MTPFDLIYSLIFLCLLLCTQITGNTVQLNSNNIDGILEHNELVMLNFYADWCRFSQMLQPVYDETAKKVAAEFPGQGKVVLGKVDCDKETSIAQKYQVTKYPTLKIFRNGQMVKREYRGQRSAEAMSKFIREQIADNIERLKDAEAAEELDSKKRHIIGYFPNEESEEFKSFLSLSSLLRDDCKFHVVINPNDEDPKQINKVVFRPIGEQATDMPYFGNLLDGSTFKEWTTDKCVPLVREITFENAEELTEEGLPFMILFHHSDDTETPQKFQKIVARELIAEKNGINFLMADGEKFTHPLYHLGKTSKDLPVLAMDSFRHMYLWKNNPKEDLDKPGLVKEFIKDLQSGKLHREFHHGPDPTQINTQSPVAQEGDKKDHVPNTQDQDEAKPDKPTNPPESSFRKLGPSKNRYTLLRDEL